MEEHESNWKNFVFYGLAWFLSCVLLVIALLFTIEMVEEILNWISMTISDVSKQRDFDWTVAAIKQGMYFISGCITVGLAVWFEYYFRKGEKVGKLFQRGFKVFAIEILVIVVAFVVRVAILALAF